MMTLNHTQANNEIETARINNSEEERGEMSNQDGTELGTALGSDQETETALPDVFVTILSDTNGSRPINIAPLLANLQGVTLTVRNILGYAQAEPGATAQIFVNNAAANLDTTVAEGDLIYVAGKLAGGTEESSEENAMSHEAQISEPAAADINVERARNDASLDDTEPEIFVTLLSDTNGSRPVNIAPLQATLQGVSLTVRNILGYAQAEPGGTAQIFVNNAAASLDTTVAEGDLIYVAGKLAGGSDEAGEVGQLADGSELDGVQVPPVYVTLLSDTNGSRPINVQPLQATLPGQSLTIRNLLGYAQAEPGTTAQIFLNNATANLDSTVVEGDLVYVAGKLAGGTR